MTALLLVLVWLASVGAAWFVGTAIGRKSDAVTLSVILGPLGLGVLLAGELLDWLAARP